MDTATPIFDELVSAIGLTMDRDLRDTDSDILGTELLPKRPVVTMLMPTLGPAVAAGEPELHSQAA